MLGNIAASLRFLEGIYTIQYYKSLKPAKSKTKEMDPEKTVEFGEKVC